MDGSGYQTKNGIVDAAKCCEQEIQCDRAYHHEKKDSHTVKFGSAGLIAEKVGYNCFHHRVPDLEMTERFMSLCPNFKRVLMK